MFTVDACIFLEVLLDQSKAETCQQFLEYAQTKNILLVCSHFSIHSIAVALSHRKKFEVLRDFIQNIQNMPNLYVHQTSLEEEYYITKVCQKEGLDFDDALQYHVTKSTNSSAIISLDKDFDKTDLKRLTPEQFLSTLTNE